MAGVTPDTELQIYYGDIAEIPSDTDIVIPAFIGPETEEIAGHFDIADVSVPIIYRESGYFGDALTCHSDTLLFSFDILRAAAQLIVEEPEFRKRGDYGRPDLSAEPDWRRELLSAPTASLYSSLLRRALSETKPETLRPLWPCDAPYAVILSHDVDRIMSGSRSYRLREALAALKQGERIHNLDVFSPAHRYDSVAIMIDMERRYDAVSTFFFSAINRGEIDPDYDAADVADLIAEVKAAGNEVALHSSFYCPDADGLREEIAALEEVADVEISGMRGHYLQPEPPECFNRSEAAGLQYDATPGVPATTAFRYGVAGPFTPWNEGEGRTFEVTAIPLACMDGTLYRYLGMNRRQTRARMYELIDTVRASGGAFSLLWHTDTFVGSGMPKWGWVYEEVLRRTVEDGAAFMTHKDCTEWYRKRRVGVEATG
jgi:hypothetical protein